MNMRMIFAAAMAASTLSGIDAADARSVRGRAAADALTICLLSDDYQTAETSTKSACCSHDAGICVICPMPPSATAPCDVVPYRQSPLPGGKSGGSGIQNQLNLFKKGA